MATGIDFDSAGSIPASAIKADGYNFVANYLGRGLTSSLVSQYENAGLAIVSIYETTYDYYHNGAYDPNPSTYYDPNNDPTGYIINVLTYWDGYYQAQRANSFAANIGQSANSAIYFAVDVGIIASTSNVVNYFQGINAGLAAVNSTYKVGIYGDGNALNAVGQSLASYEWWAYGWRTSAYQSPTSHNISQTDNNSNSDGFAIRVDHDVATGSSYGQWGVSSNHPPVVTAQNVSVAPNQSIAASSMIGNISDQDGDTITQYAFWDSGSGAGHFIVNGTTQASGQWIYVTAANLSTINYVGAASAASETLCVAAYDGHDWSQNASLTATTVAATNHPPVVTVSDHSLHANEWAQMSNWVSYSDADGNPAVSYAFYDGGTDANSGYFWTPTNAHNSADTSIVAAASDLANVWVRGGAKLLGRRRCT